MILAAIAGALIGGISGFVISKFSSKLTGGVCPIMCNPRISIPYFAFLGSILASQFVH
jgi:hypothetical protein